MVNIYTNQQIQPVQQPSSDHTFIIVHLII